MNHPLHAFRDLASSPSEAVRWSCVLEATAPKPGNVFPGRSFDDLHYADFIAAADISARSFGNPNTPVSSRMLQAVQQTRSQLQTNVNLGIILLLGPLVAADESCGSRHPPDQNLPGLLPVISGVLKNFDEDDGRRIFLAIQTASAGGLGSSEALDVNDSHESVDIVHAMNLAKDRDRIALQYATGFRDLVERVLPTVRDSIAQCGDILAGIAQAHVRILAESTDSLIARKNSAGAAIEVQQRASQVDVQDSESMNAMDQFLRSKGNQFNPGTTADLIAAAIYLLLRTNDEGKQS